MAHRVHHPLSFGPSAAARLILQRQRAARLARRRAPQPRPAPACTCPECGPSCPGCRVGLHRP